MTPVILAFPDSQTQARRLAEALELKCREVALHHFPDGESKLTLPATLPAHVIILRSLNQPNDKLVELLLASETAREQGVQRLTLVAPYLCYMRQDKAFHPGEAVSQGIIGRFLAQHFDHVLTVDTHLHRISNLSEAVPAGRAINISAAGALGNFLVQQNLQPLLLGPDAESLQWVSRIAETGNFEFAVAEKTRLGDRKVSINLPQVDFNGKTIVMVDDMVSSGHTMTQAVQSVLAAGAKEVHCLITHALFADDAVALLKSAGVQQIWSSDSIIHSSNVVELAPFLAEALKPLLES